MTQQIRILFYDHCARMSGAEIALLHTAAALDKDSVRAVLGEVGPLGAALQARDVPVDILPLPESIVSFSRRRVGPTVAGLKQAVRVLRYGATLHTLLVRRDIDVIVSNSMKGHVILALFAVLNRKSPPLVCYVRDRVSTDFMSRGGVVLMQTILRSIPVGIVANSRATLETVPDSRRHRLRVVIPSPIPEPLGGRERVDGLDSFFKFGIVGRLTQWKGQELAIRAFARAFAEGSEQLHVVGGPLFGEERYQNRLKTMVREMRLEGRVIFHGHVDDVYQKMREWDCLVHSSVIPEPFGQVVVQGMAMGLPVIASGEGGPAETITDGVDGLLFTPRDEVALAEVLLRVRGDRSLNVRLGEAARATAARYRPAAIAERLTSELSSLVEASVSSH